MSRRVSIAVVGLAAVLTAGEASLSQDCHDWDGDGFEGGIDCVTETDCEDRAWRRHDGAAEVCNGFDDDCDGLLDFGCETSCGGGSLHPLFTSAQPASPSEAFGGCVAHIDDGFIAFASLEFDATPGEYHLWARPFDLRGAPLGPGHPVGDGVAPIEELNCKAVGGGDRAAVAFRGEDGPDQPLLARVVDARGRPLGEHPVDLSATWTPEAPVWGGSWDIEWNGEEFAVFWTPRELTNSRRWVMMSRIDSEGAFQSPSTVRVTDDGTAEQDTIQQHHVVWTGDHYVDVVWVDNIGADDESRIYPLKISRDGVLEQRNLIPGRFNRANAAMGSDRVGVVLSWDDSFATERLKAFFVALDLDGAMIPGTGPVELSDDSAFTYQMSRNILIEWTGALFAAAFPPSTGGFTPEYIWRFSRITPDGTALDPGSILLQDNPSLGDMYDLHWTGEDFVLFAGRNSGSGQLTRNRILCDCSDQDVDGHGACVATECDDDDPFANALLAETCRGLTDDDCDGAIDCEDPDCTVTNGPADISDVRWDGQALVWTAPGGSERFDVARGLVSDLRRTGDLLLTECAGPERASPSWSDDGRVPPAGDVLFYVVRPEGVPCALGSFGSDSSGVEREIAACR